MTETDSGVLVEWAVPLRGGDGALQVAARPGEVTAFVGANGSGKSALGYWLNKNSGQVVVKRLIAHRQLWFEHAGPNLTAANRDSTSVNIASSGNQARSRWVDGYHSNRVSLTLFDLMARLNERNSRLAQLHDGGATRSEIDEAVEPSILDELNAVLAHARMEFSLQLTKAGTFDASWPEPQRVIPLSKLSDGEKSAVLLAADVLTAPDACVLILDEPERHLHRSISSSLIDAVLASRSDCHFVLLTHDLELAADLVGESSTVVSVAACEWVGDEPAGWDINLVPDGGSIPESSRRAILGGRRNLLFLEGTPASLDVRLFEILFPEWSLHPVGGCEEVIRAVAGLAGSEELHWVTARGVVDGDGRSLAERKALADKGILVLPVAEIESIYYSAPVVSAVANRRAELAEASPEDLISEAHAKSLEAIGSGDTPSRLAATVATSVVARLLSSRSPTRNEVAAAGAEVSVTVASPLRDLEERIVGLIEAGDLEAIVREFPIRDTSMPGVVAQSLRFPRTSDYLEAARRCIRSDAALRATLLNQVGEIPSPP